MSATIAAKLVKDVALIKVQMKHASEDGQRMDNKTHKLIPSDFVQQISIMADGRLIASADLGGGLAHNPEFMFKAKALKLGAKISVEWLDSKGDKGNTETVLIA